MSTSMTTFQGTVNATVRVNAPVLGTTAGNLTLNPTGTTIAAASGKTIAVDQITSATPATNLTLNATGPNIDFSGKTLTGVGGITSPVLQALALAAITTADATPVALGTLPLAANTCYIITADVAAVSPAGGPATASAAWRAVLRAVNKAGTVTTDLMWQSQSIETALAGVDIGFAASGTNVLLNVTGLGATNVRWGGLLSYQLIAV